MAGRMGVRDFGEFVMADRKQFLNVVAADVELVRLLNETRSIQVTDDLLREQRISFAFGNAPYSQENITRDSVRRASESMRLRT